MPELRLERERASRTARQVSLRPWGSGRGRWVLRREKLQIDRRWNPFRRAPLVLANPRKQRFTWLPDPGYPARTQPSTRGLGHDLWHPSAPRWGGHVGPGRISPLISTWQKAAESRTREGLEVKSAHQEPLRSRRQTAPRGEGRPPPQHPTSPRPSFGSEGEAIPDTPTAASLTPRFCRTISTPSRCPPPCLRPRRGYLKAPDPERPDRRHLLWVDVS